MKAVFFYGLFMDVDLLVEAGCHPSDVFVACAQGYGLRIGERATLVESPGEQAYGVVASLSEEALQRLYAQPSLAGYIPVTLRVRDLQGIAVTASCYVLPEQHLAGRNPDYAHKLVLAAQKVNLPQQYIERLHDWCGN